MKKLIPYIMVLGVLVFSAATAMAESLRITTVGLPPYGYKDKGEFVGMSYEIGNALAEKSGYEPNNKLAPLARAVNDLASGTTDVVIMFPTPNVERVAHSVGTVMNVQCVVLARSETVLRSERDLRGKTLASVRGALYDSGACKRNGVILQPVENYEQGVKMLLARRVDGVIGPRLGLLYTVEKMRLPPKAFGKPFVVTTTPACLFLSTKSDSPEMRDRLAKALEVLGSDGTIKNIVSKYSL
ncbi:transporter substrate-binding domain-containing protein [Pseudodesulfovibrio sp. zrk46]|uniref:substrate-binding periplasmic protein n=1 Tax=Pseudodesulfovibrio sp. zrk46 TaxID=2725288 RepID=UPI001448BC8E|nr:transporter substrate-binding domain-containing protein [Pseudodesulfovibrio sp. zrk46]QJB56219.1 amino acid ABC transporter substrate-binding protein [Pseudodesulfovibrio sp. zrk46]